MFDFINIQLIDVIDILLVGLLVYQIYKLIRGTAALSIFLGIIIIYVVWIIVKSLNMSLLTAILGQVLGVGVIALIILFQQEITTKSFQGSLIARNFSLATFTAFQGLARRHL